MSNISKILSDMSKNMSDISKNDMTNSIFSDRSDMSFSGDLNKFNESCVEFISFIKQCVENVKENKVYVFLYMLRNGNSINYGEYEHGLREKKGTIEMISNEDLRKLYELLQDKFATDFIGGCKHTFGEGWSLNPTIGENVMIDINSCNSYDKDWFYEEVHKEQKSNSPKIR